MTDTNTIVSDSDRSTDNEALRALDRIAPILSKTRRNSKPGAADELIGALSDAYENRRARQVFEWEKARRGRTFEL